MLGQEPRDDREIETPVPARKRRNVSPVPVAGACCSRDVVIGPTDCHRVVEAEVRVPVGNTPPGPTSEDVVRPLVDKWVTELLESLEPDPESLHFSPARVPFEDHSDAETPVSSSGPTGSSVGSSFIERDSDPPGDPSFRLSNSDLGECFSF